MAKKRSDKSSCSLVWDFRDVPSEELHACFLYEYARESRRIRALARRLAGPSTPGSADEPGSPFMLLQSMNRDCARVLNQLSEFSPQIDLERVSWFDYGKRPRQAAAVAAKRELGFKPLRKRGEKGLAFFWASNRPLLSRWGWEQVFSDQEKHPDQKSRVQVEAFQINWCEGIEAVLEDARSWLEANKPAATPARRQAKGRHAKPESYYRDKLRMLGAVRLLSVYPLKEAIRVSHCYHRDGGSIYSSSPAGQSAWENAVKGAARTFHETFDTFQGDGPISEMAYRARQQLRSSTTK